MNALSETSIASQLVIIGEGMQNTYLTDTWKVH